MPMWAPSTCCWACSARATTRPTSSRNLTSSHGPGAEEILAQRLARGEIDPGEYRQRLQTIQETTNRA